MSFIQPFPSGAPLQQKVQKHYANKGPQKSDKQKYTLRKHLGLTPPHQCAFVYWPRCRCCLTYPHAEKLQHLLHCHSTHSLAPDTQPALLLVTGMTLRHYHITQEYMQYGHYMLHDEPWQVTWQNMTCYMMNYDMTWWIMTCYLCGQTLSRACGTPVSERCRCVLITQPFLSKIMPGYAWLRKAVRLLGVSISM